MQTVNGFMSIHLAATFTINILLGCLWLYVLFWDLDFYRNDPAGLVMLVFWFVVGTIYLAVDTFTSCHGEFRSTDIVYFSLKTFDSWICLFPISKIPNLFQAHEPFETINKLRVNEETATPGFQIQVSDGLLIYFHKMFLFLCFSLYLYNITGAAFSGQINRAANRTDSFKHVCNW